MGEEVEGGRIETGIDIMAVVREMIDHINLRQGTIRGMNRGEGMTTMTMDGNEDVMAIIQVKEGLAKDTTGDGEISVVVKFFTGNLFNVYSIN